MSIQQIHDELKNIGNTAVDFSRVHYEKRQKKYCYVINFRLTQKQYLQFLENVQKENTDVSSFIRKNIGVDFNV